jgi:hypothetical protein
MYYVITIGYAIFLAFWRRWFGGGLDFLPDNRALKHIVGFLVGCGALWYMDYSWVQIVLTMLGLQGLYWARGHGEFFDYGHHQPPDIKRYEEFWWWKYVKLIIPNDQLYKWHCDFICMAIRYTLPAVLIGVILLRTPIMFSGTLLACGYGLMWLFYDWGYLKKPTNYGEYIGGFITGLLLTA